VFVKACENADERAVLHKRAFAHVDSKPVKMCNHLTCMLRKTGKAAWCATHRKVFENGRADAERQNSMAEFKKFGLRNCILMVEFMDSYIAAVGLPGQRLGKNAGDFDWLRFMSEKFASSSVNDVQRVMKLDHVGWVQHYTVERAGTSLVLASARTLSDASRRSVRAARCVSTSAALLSPTR
jgi:hypothetical protein